MVKTKAENIDKKDKESLKALSDKIPPPQIKYQLNIILFYSFIVNESVEDMLQCCHILCFFGEACCELEINDI